jgi:hypothetical protein
MDVKCHYNTRLYGLCDAVTWSEDASVEVFTQAALLIQVVLVPTPCSYTVGRVFSAV